MTTIPSTTLDRFLCAFANHGWPDADRAHRRGAFLRFAGNSAAEATARWLQGHKVFSRMIPNDRPEFPLWNRVVFWQGELQAIFGEGTQSEREDRIFMNVAYYGSFEFTGRDAQEPGERYEFNLRTPERLSQTEKFYEHYFRIRENVSQPNKAPTGLKPDGFMQALRRALEVAPKMRKCPNPECYHPFFLARRSPDRYCSKKCALWGKRKSNLKSWNLNWKRWPSTRWRAKGGRKKYLRKGKQQ